MAKWRPLCRYCGKPIAKRVSYVVFGVAPCEQEKGRGRTEQPTTRADAQRFVNGQIASVRYSTSARVDGDISKIGKMFGVPEGSTLTLTVEVPRYIQQVSVWDGESFSDDYFCSGKCAQGYGYFAIKHPGYDTKAYSIALANQAGRET